MGAVTTKVSAAFGGQQPLEASVSPSSSQAPSPGGEGTVPAPPPVPVLSLQGWPWDDPVQRFLANVLLAVVLVLAIVLVVDRIVKTLTSVMRGSTVLVIMGILGVVVIVPSSPILFSSVCTQGAMATMPAFLGSIVGTLCGPK